MRIASGTAIILGLMSTPAQSENQRAQVWGIGQQSCATWMQDRYQGDVWLLGFWSGLNINNPTTGTVGTSTDANGLTAAVKKKCMEDPAALLVSAAIQVYRDFEKAGR